MALADKANIVVKAAGLSGSDIDYVRKTYDDLKGVGIDDPAVTALWKAVKNHPGRPKQLHFLRDEKNEAGAHPDQRTGRQKDEPADRARAPMNLTR